MLPHPHFFLLSWLFSPNTAQESLLTFRAVFCPTIQVIGILESPSHLLKKLLKTLPPNHLNWLFIFLCSIPLHGPYTWIECQPFHFISLFPFCPLSTRQCFLWRSVTHTHTHTHPGLGFQILPRPRSGRLTFFPWDDHTASDFSLCNHPLKDQRSFCFPILHIHVGNLLFLHSVNIHWQANKNNDLAFTKCYYKLSALWRQLVLLSLIVQMRKLGQKMGR